MDIAEQLAPVFAASSEGVIVYLDDRHKICNDRLAKLFGYASPKEWAAAPDFLNSFVATPADRVRVSRTYHRQIHQLVAPARIRYKVRRPDGKTIACEMDSVPFTHAGQMFAYQFVREVKASRKRTAPSGSRRSKRRAPTKRVRKARRRPRR